MKRVLIVSPHFSPTNAPDMQRTRLALPHLRAHGWEPTVLAVHPKMVEGGVNEPLLEQTYPHDLRIVRARGVAPAATRRFGFGSLWWRCGGALRRAGDAILGAEHFSAVLFSTAQFGAFTLGPRWRRRYAVPYVLDYQDPWRTDYYRRTGTRPPGGRLKFGLSQLVARVREPNVVGKAAAIIVTSPAYAGELRRRYPAWHDSAIDYLPFGASPLDLALAQEHPPKKPLIDFADGNVHFVYAGRCGPAMRTALSALFRAFARFRTAHPGEAERLRFHFIGTDYAPPPLGQESVMPWARAEGVEAQVREVCYRVPYFEVLHYLTRAHALLSLGTNDSSYAASKLVSYLLVQQPLLLVYHEKSPGLQLAQEIGGGAPIAFADETPIDTLAGRIEETWFRDARWRQTPIASWSRLVPHLAETSTTRLAAVLDRVQEDG
ncbi:MAG TPA: hypothetical protein VHF69_02830 [Candidatus Synoicihabitans sp.]|nr:hypothetical protein [Candidatus Synoicihabitans sp.]